MLITRFFGSKPKVEIDGKEVWSFFIGKRGACVSDDGKVFFNHAIIEREPCIYWGQSPEHKHTIMVYRKDTPKKILKALSNHLGGIRVIGGSYGYHGTNI